MCVLSTFLKVVFKCRLCHENGYKNTKLNENTVKYLLILIDLLNSTMNSIHKQEFFKTNFCI